MSYSDIVGSISGVLQFAVACYALRVSRRFGFARVGWYFFGAFSLLALVHVILSVHPFGIHLEWNATVNFIYEVISVLLLATISQTEVLLWQHRQKEHVEQPAQEESKPAAEPQAAPTGQEPAKAELELARIEQERAKAELARAQAEQERAKAELQREELALANKQLQESATKLQADLDQQKQAQEQVEKTYKEQLTASRRSEEMLRDILVQVQTDLDQQKKLQEQLEKTYQDQLATLSHPNTEQRENVVPPAAEPGRPEQKAEPDLAELSDRSSKKGRRKSRVSKWLAGAKKLGSGRATVSPAMRRSHSVSAARATKWLTTAPKKLKSDRPAVAPARRQSRNATASRATKLSATTAKNLKSRKAPAAPAPRRPHAASANGNSSKKGGRHTTSSSSAGRKLSQRMQLSRSLKSGKL